MKTGQTVRIKSTQEIGTILEINDDLIKVYINNRGTFRYAKSNIEPIDRIPIRDSMENMN